MAGKRRFFTSEGYKRLERNPFVDKKMLAFMREEWRKEARNAAPDRQAATGKRSGRPDAAAPDKTGSKLTEENIRRMTETIKSMLRE